MIAPESSSSSPAQDGFRDGWIQLDSIGLAMIVCDGEQRLRGASPAAHNLFQRAGHPIGAPGGKLPEGLFVALRNAIAEQALWRSAPGGLLVGVSRYPLGDRHWVLVMREVPEGGRVQAPTDAADVRLARRLHEQRLEVTGRLVVTLAHDLRNPLASILLNIEALRALNLTDDGQAAVDDVMSAAARVSRAIDALVEFGRLGPPSVDDVSLEELGNRVVGALRPALREGHHTLHLDVDSVWVCANPMLLEQILGNLITNSIESCSEGVTVVVRARVDGDVVRISVRDDGPGIPAHMLERVFEPFHTSQLGRVGLGLTIAREAAQSMNGQLVARQVEGAGAHLEMTLPGAHRRNA